MSRVPMVAIIWLDPAAPEDSMAERGELVGHPEMAKGREAEQADIMMIRIGFPVPVRLPHEDLTGQGPSTEIER